MFQPEALNEAWTHDLFITNEVSLRVKNYGGKDF